MYKVEFNYKVINLDITVGMIFKVIIIITIKVNKFISYVIIYNNVKTIYIVVYKLFTSL